MATVTDGEKRPLGKLGEDFLVARQIDPELAVQRGVYTCRPDAKLGVVVPDANGHILAFPYIDHEQEVGTKYRDIRSKRFWQSQGGVATFYGADLFDDPAVTSGEARLVIVEGELDKLSVETAGHPFVVSVPEGAPPPPRPDRVRRGEPSAADDMTGKFRFMFNNQDRLQAVKRFILAVDGDAAGKCLENEIIRRILVPRCARVKYPAGCKDLNEVLMKHGKQAVLDMLHEAKPYPLEGIYSLQDYTECDFVTYSSGLPNLDPHFKLFEGQFVVITGVPGHGKFRGGFADRGRGGQALWLEQPDLLAGDAGDPAVPRPAAQGDRWPSQRGRCLHSKAHSLHRSSAVVGWQGHLGRGDSQARCRGGDARRHPAGDHRPLERDRACARSGGEHQRLHRALDPGDAARGTTT
jgi:hypothetical protein